MYTLTHSNRQSRHRTPEAAVEAVRISRRRKGMGRKAPNIDAETLEELIAVQAIAAASRIRCDLTLKGKCPWE